MNDIMKAFAIEGKPVSCQVYGNGYINVTYLIESEAGNRYILQKINRHVFKDIPGLMRNIQAVSQHLRMREKDPRKSLHLVPTLKGQPYYVDGQGEYWRAYGFIENAICLDAAQCPEDFYQSAVAFGRFQAMLSDFPAHTLKETIHRFHDTPWRYEALHQAISADAMGRVSHCPKEIEFALSHQRVAGEMIELHKKGQLPLRVTHNDTKLSNVMLDATTHTALCVIDLDTVMPGLVGNDFGDSIRFGASTALEDETDLSRVALSLSYFEAYARGYLSACGDYLTPLEIETLPLGAKLMTLECGIRFLTDYLKGDTYFRIHREHHNLDRCRTQFKLVADMTDKKRAMAQIIKRVQGRG